MQNANNHEQNVQNIEEKMELLNRQNALMKEI